MAKSCSEWCRLLPVYGPSPSAARTKPVARFPWALARRLRNSPGVLAPLSAALFLTVTQFAISYAKKSSELSHTRVLLSRADKSSYTLAMRVAWLEEALILANRTALTGERHLHVSLTELHL